MGRTATAAWLVAVLSLVLGACSTGDETGAATSFPVSSPTSAGLGSEVAREPSPGGAAVRPSRGCDHPVTDAGTDEVHELSVHGQTRSYLVTTPGGTEPLPLVVALHGIIEGPEVHSLHTGLGEFGVEHGFVTVFPRGRGEPISWDASAAEGNPDLDFVDEVVANVAARRCIDESRVYATGLSNGAMLASTLACVRTDRFAAIAPVAGVLAPAECDPSRPLPLLTTHGTEDPVLAFHELGGNGVIGQVDAWAQRNGCDPEPTEAPAGESVVHRTYDCPPDAAVELYVVEGGGHTWPGSEFSSTIESVTGPATFEIDWNELLWEFFQRYSID